MHSCIWYLTILPNPSLSSLDELNLDPALDYLTSLKTHFGNEDKNPYNLYNIQSCYLDNQSFAHNLKNSNKPTFLGLNIQSLHSKYFNLKSFILSNEANGPPISLIALQETWNIQDTNAINIPNFNFIFKKRTKFRGGIVGFYIKKGISYKILENLSSFTEKIFECLTVQLTINSKTIVISNIYRSPSPLANQSPSEHYDEFILKFEHLLAELANIKHESYIFMDSNINLINLNLNTNAISFLECALQHGFIQTVNKATRIFNEKISLIDQIFTNSKNLTVNSGVIINDISDHFITFIQPSLTSMHSSKKHALKQDISRHRMARFKEDLGNLRWRNVLACEEVDKSFNLFWQDFKTLYDLHFPLKQVKFNKNLHSINKFMTGGLLISRSNKNRLHKLSITSRSIENSTTYRNYRNIYNSVLRASKKIFFWENLQQ